eukprot:TRINITY_DN12136_c0_g1_i2.p1 TRINITY_DN12136_c0_g1~~TRINITY_DN12136_c0_g1_i2.p1  ORF type:complete len:488 (-),score=78.78 TRINITY_DN12136_c0_g1_i2:51-1514(-)
MGDGQSSCRSGESFFSDGQAHDSVIIDTAANAAAEEENATKLAGAPGNIKTKMAGREKPFWQEQEGDKVATSIGVIEAMLEKDDLSAGQQEDLKYVLRTLQKSKGHRSSIQCALIDAKNKYSDVDGTIAYLAEFGAVEVMEVRKKRGLKDVVKGVRFAMGLSKSVQKKRATNIITEDDQDRRWAQHIQSWDDFNIFEASSICGPNLLERVTLTVIVRSNLLEHFGISRTRITQFLCAIESQYKANAYHNALHAADTTQTVFVMIQALRSGVITELEQLTMLIASACHDVGHPGVTNNFRIAAMDEGALIYNDRSINENMHCSLTFRTLQEGDCSFTEPFTRKQFSAVRKLLIEIILSTDMAFHFTKLDALKNMVAEKSAELGTWDSLTPVINMMVHAADVSNPAKPQYVATKWGDLVSEEFFAQGDEERKFGFDISPMCNRFTVVKSESQRGFMDFIVGPIFEQLNALVDVSTALSNIQEPWLSRSS